MRKLRGRKARRRLDMKDNSFQSLLKKMKPIREESIHNGHPCLQVAEEDLLEILLFFSITGVDCHTVPVGSKRWLIPLRKGLESPTLGTSSDARVVAASSASAQRWVEARLSSSPLPQGTSVRADVFDSPPATPAPT